jgi:hypothetical protein
MRILFLDVDGVLHPAPDVRTSLTHFCWLSILARALAPFDDVNVVVHSSWRDVYDLNELREMLDALGPRVLGVTTGTARWESIEAWVRLHQGRVRSFRVLDDMPGEFPDPAPLELILCKPDLGVSDPEVQARMREWLESSTTSRPALSRAGGSRPARAPKEL